MPRLRRISVPGTNSLKKTYDMVYVEHSSASDPKIIRDRFITRKTKTEGSVRAVSCLEY